QATRRFGQRRLGSGGAASQRAKIRTRCEARNSGGASDALGCVAGTLAATGACDPVATNRCENAQESLAGHDVTCVNARTLLDSWWPEKDWKPERADSGAWCGVTLACASCRAGPVQRWRAYMKTRQGRVHDIRWPAFGPLLASRCAWIGKQSMNRKMRMRILSNCYDRGCKCFINGWRPLRFETFAASTRIL